MYDLLVDTRYARVKFWLSLPVSQNNVSFLESSANLVFPVFSFVVYGAAEIVKNLEKQSVLRKLQGCSTVTHFWVKSFSWVSLIKLHKTTVNYSNKKYNFMNCLVKVLNSFYQLIYFAFFIFSFLYFLFCFCIWSYMFMRILKIYWSKINM